MKSALKYLEVQGKYNPILGILPTQFLTPKFPELVLIVPRGPQTQNPKKSPSSPKYPPKSLRGFLRGSVLIGGHPREFTLNPKGLKMQVWG